MPSIAFNEDELKVIKQVIPQNPDINPYPLYNFPVKPRQAYLSLLEKKPIWQITGLEKQEFCPEIIPDNIARGIVVQAENFPMEKLGGKDMFGVEWIFNPGNGGSAVDPFQHLFTDANEWTEKLTWPDVDSWDWAGSAEKNKDFVTSGYFISPIIFSGYFERLISFMDFGNASIAMVDEPQKDAVKALFKKLTDLYIDIIDRFIEYFDVDSFTVHDDWGAQRGPLFSEDTAEEMIVPEMRRLTDYIHSKRKFAELHSCGLLEQRVHLFIKAGWDIWTPQLINDTRKLYNEYGDKIILGVEPERYKEEMDEKELTSSVTDFVEKFCNPDKPMLLNFESHMVLPEAYREKLYKLSRIKFNNV